MKRDNTPEITRNTMVKKVNIIARLPVRTLYPPIHGTYEGINMSPANILKCLLHKAYVEEVLEDGSTLELNMQNYNTVNKPAVKKPEPKLENRKSAVLDPVPTMDQLRNKTANIPQSHFLYDIKKENDSEELMDSHEAAKNDKKAVEAEIKVSTTDPVRDLPIAKAEEDTPRTEFEKNSGKEESDSSDQNQ